MPVNKINSVTEVKTNTQNKAASSDKQEQKIDNKTGKILLISALTALAAGGIYLASRGRKVRNLTNAENKAAGSLADNKSNIETQVKEIGIDVFKKQGNKFIKGKAKLANGENYTGQLTHKAKDGRNITLEYKDGILQKVSDAEHIKEYHYDEDGKISDILKDNTSVYNKTLIKDRYVPMTCIETSKSKIYIDADTKKIRKLIEKNPLSDNFVYKLFDENGVLKHFIIKGKDGSNKFISYYPDGKNKQLEIISNGKFATFSDCFFYDKQGNLKEKIKVMQVAADQFSAYGYDGVEMEFKPALGGWEYRLSDTKTGKMKAQFYESCENTKLTLTDLFADDKQFRRTEIDEGNTWKPVYYEIKNRKNGIFPKNDLYNKFLELENLYLSEVDSKRKKADILLKIITRQSMSKISINANYSDLLP